MKKTEDLIVTALASNGMGKQMKKIAIIVETYLYRLQT